MKQSTIRLFISLGILFVLVLFFSTTSEYFFTTRNIFSIFRDASIVGIMAIGVTFVILISGIDLSTGSILGLVGMSMANVYKFTNLPIWLMIVIGIFVGVLCGVFNGFLVSKLKLPPFIATLATLGIYRAITYVIAIVENGEITSQKMTDANFASLAGNFHGFYYVTFVFVIMVIIAQIVLKYTSFGAKVYATGTSIKSSELAGINTNKIIASTFIISGFCCGIASVFMCSKMQSAAMQLGTGMEFNVIAAVVVGGCALKGGRGDIVGSFIGAIFMTVLDNGIYQYQIDTSYQPIIKGIIIILVVIFDAWYIKKMEQKAHNRKIDLKKEVL